MKGNGRKRKVRTIFSSKRDKLSVIEHLNDSVNNDTIFLRATLSLSGATTKTPPIFRYLKQRTRYFS